MNLSKQVGVITLIGLVGISGALASPPPPGWNKNVGKNQVPAQKPAAKLSLAPYPGNLKVLKPMVRVPRSRRAKEHEKSVAIGEKVMAGSDNVAYATKDDREKVFAYYTKVLTAQGFTNHAPRSAVGGEGGETMGFMNMASMTVVMINYFPENAFKLYLAPGEQPPAGASGITVMITKM